MTLMFPSIRCPTERTYKPGQYPIRTFVAQNGATTRIARGDRVNGATLTLEYAYISNADKAAVMQFWNDCLGGFRAVSLPAAAFEGDPGFKATVPAYLNWYMQEPETSTPQGYPPGFSRLSVSFVGELPA